MEPLVVSKGGLECPVGPSRSATAPPGSFTKELEVAAPTCVPMPPVFIMGSSSPGKDPVSERSVSAA